MKHDDVAFYAFWKHGLAHLQQVVIEEQKGYEHDDTFFAVNPSKTFNIIGNGAIFRGWHVADGKNAFLHEDKQKAIDWLRDTGLIMIQEAEERIQRDQRFIADMKMKLRDIKYKDSIIVRFGGKGYIFYSEADVIKARGIYAHCTIHALEDQMAAAGINFNLYDEG